jgi:hypothetical protein
MKFEPAFISSTNEIITVSLEIKDVPNFAGYKVNLLYDPAVLQPVKVDETGTVTPYEPWTFADNGTLLVNPVYTPFQGANHDLVKGTLNFSKGYISLTAYRSSVPESTGSVSAIKFLVLQPKETSVLFDSQPYMKYAIDGFYLMDWDGNPLPDFKVIQPSSLTVGPSSIKAGDMNKDGVIDSTDLAILKRIILGLETENVSTARI